MPYCFRCGANNVSEAKFCDSCGIELPPGQSMSVSPMPTPAAPRPVFISRGGALAEVTVLQDHPPIAAPRVPTAEPVQIEPSVLRKRYADAYAVARSLIDQGNWTKILGGILGAMVFVSGFLLGQSAGRAGFPGSTAAPVGMPVLSLIVGVAIGLYLYRKGVILCAFGQTLLALLDCAVHTSPFMSDKVRAEAMSLFGFANSVSLF